MALEATLEAALAAVEREADPVFKSAASVTKELRKARACAKVGQVRDLRRALLAAESLGEQLASSARELRESFDFDEQAYLSSGDYAKELMAASQAADVAMFEEDERLLCYPSLVRVLPGEAAVEIDRVRERRLRPSVLVAQLSATQQKAPRFRPEPFLDSLCSAYELVVAREDKQRDAVVRLIDVWSVLTMLPGQSREYTKQEFARDLYLLDQCGHTDHSRSGRRLRWSASTGTKGAGVLSTVARSGQQQRYWGIAFTQPSDQGS